VRPSWRGWSLRARLTAAATLAVAVLLAAGGALLVWRLHVGMLHDLDATAVREVLTVSAAADGSTPPHIPPTPGQSVAVQILDASGRVVASSPDIEGEPAMFGFPPPPAGAGPALATAHPASLGAGTYRVAAVTTRHAPHYRVYVGLPQDQADRNTAALAATLAVGLPALLAALAAVTWWLSSRALHPVEVLRRQTADITTNGLHRRLDVPPADDELSRLADTLNDLLARLEASQRQQRQFVADAAHELRSPVTAIRAQLETTDIPEEVKTLLVADSVRLAHLVDDLLALARLDADPRLRLDEVDIDDVARAEIASLRPRTTLQIHAHNLRTIRVLGDEALLGRAIRNLLDNAARYATDRIDVSAHDKNGDAVLVIADDGPGIPTTDRERAFGRFTRLDGARSRDAGGVGLGLAIVKDIVHRHGGTTTIHDNHPGTRIVIQLPAAPTP
jgi:signal transduction histidine kinase